MAGAGVPNPTKSADEDHTTSSVCTAVLKDSLLDSTSLVIANHQTAIRKGQGAAQSSKRPNAAAKLSSLLNLMQPFDFRQTTRNTETDAWISVQPTLINGLLSKDE